MTISFDVDLGKEKEKLKIEFNSILNKSIVELEAMDIEDLRNRVLDEVKSLELEKDNIRNFKLQKIFEKLLDLQPSSSRRSFSDEHLLVEEQRLYTDLISIPGLFESDYVRDFLEKKFVPVDLDMSFKRELLINILEFYDKSSDDLIDKFNYIFKSSDEVSTVLLYYPHFLKDVLFTDMLELFDKEDIGQLYRFFLSNSDKRFEFQDSLNNHKIL